MLLRTADYKHLTNMTDCLPAGTIAIYETLGDDMIVLYGHKGKTAGLSGGDPGTVVPWCHKHGFRLSRFDREGEGYGWHIDFDAISQRDDFIRTWRL
jgi:hypothetical protein